MAKRLPTTRPKSTDAAGPAQPKPRKPKAAPAAAPEAAIDPGAPGAVAEPSPEDIRRRAYERYQQRGGNHGRHFDDWLEAEKELKMKK